jgi:hypothetical protein
MRKGSTLPGYPGASQRRQTLATGVRWSTESTRTSPYFLSQSSCSCATEAE